jgi:hypothetical protein
MTKETTKKGFVSRPGDPDRWIASVDGSGRRAAALGYTARLTIDITPALRGRIKVAAFQRGKTVADMLRDLLAREFPADDGGAP